jgi:Domain of unknown function (DUF1906)
MTSGVDYAWSHPTPAALKAAKVAFVMRYLAPDRSKSLTKSEATALAAAGIWVGVVWESTANRALAGKVGGVADAKAAAAQATACGMPAGRPIYFAVDFDATEAQQTQINAYLDGAASVIGRDRVGIYGGYYPVKRALDAGKAVWAWQTIAWSGGQWDAWAHIRQGAQKTIGGVSCDLNTSMQADFGQWMPGGITPEVDPMAGITKQDIHDAVWKVDDIGAPADAPDVKTNPTWQPASILRDIQAQVRATTKTEAAQTAAITALAKLVGTNSDTAAVVAAVQQAIAAAVVHVNVDVTGTTP